MGVTSAFAYKEGHSFLHRCPAWIKLFFVPAISILIFKVPSPAALCILVLQTLLCFCLGFTLKEQLKDLQAVLYYAAILIFAKFIGAFFTGGIQKEFFYDLKETSFLLLKLLCVMQTASLVFKTSTSLQLREGLEKIERAVRKILHLKGKSSLSDSLAFFVCFIPQVAKNWEQAKKAWFARGGKKSLRMLLVLLPVLFSVGMKQAYNSAKALTIRKNP